MQLWYKVDVALSESKITKKTEALPGDEITMTSFPANNIADKEW